MVITVDGFFIPLIGQWMEDLSSSVGIGSSDRAENEGNVCFYVNYINKLYVLIVFYMQQKNNLSVKSVLPHRIQATLSKDEPPQGNEENGGIGNIANNFNNLYLI